MSPVTGLARLAGRILSSVHMENFTPVNELRFRPLPRRTRRDLSSFIPVTGLKSSYGKIFNSIAEVNESRSRKPS